MTVLLTFAEAAAIGQEAHDRFVAMMGSAPLGRDDQGWGDMVQFIVRHSNDAAAARPASSLYLELSTLAKQLERQAANAAMAGPETGVRVADPAWLVDVLRRAARAT